MIVLTTFLTCLLAIAVYGAVRWQHLVQTAFIEGRRSGLKEAIEAAKERGDVAVLVAPVGMLLPALQRAHTAAQIELDIRDLLRKVR